MDSFHLLGQVEGSRFTRWRVHGDRLDQSHLDRIYILGLGWWPHQITNLKHVQMLGFLDHDPVVLMIHLTTPSGLAREINRSLFFKANPTLNMASKWQRISKL